MHFYRIWNWNNCRSLFWRDHVTLEKLLIFSKDFFLAFVQIYFQSSSEWLIGFTVYDTSYLYVFSFFKYWTEVKTDLVLNRSCDVMQFFSWYCANTVPNLSLVISGIYDVRKRKSEYLNILKVSSWIFNWRIITFYRETLSKFCPVDICKSKKIVWKMGLRIIRHISIRFLKTLWSFVCLR